MSIKAMEMALEALHEAVAFREGGLRKAIEAVDALRTSIRQAEAQQPDNAACKSVQKRLEAQQPATTEPVAWMASYVDPIGNDHVYVTSHYDLAVENDMRGTPRPLYTHQAPSVPATSEPVKAAPYNPTEEMRWAMKRIDPDLSSEQCRALWSAAWSVAPSTHPAPSVPGDVVRDAGRWQELERRIKVNELRLCRVAHTDAWGRLDLEVVTHPDAFIDDAMLAAK